jgi:hypothetical protein
VQNGEEDGESQPRKTEKRCLEKERKVRVLAAKKRTLARRLVQCNFAIVRQADNANLKKREVILERLTCTEREQNGLL